MTPLLPPAARLGGAWGGECWAEPVGAGRSLWGLGRRFHEFPPSPRQAASLPPLQTGRTLHLKVSSSPFLGLGRTSRACEDCCFCHFARSCDLSPSVLTAAPPSATGAKVRGSVSSSRGHSACGARRLCCWGPSLDALPPAPPQRRAPTALSGAPWGLIKPEKRPRNSAASQPVRGSQRVLPRGCARLRTAGCDPGLRACPSMPVSSSEPARTVYLPLPGAL